MNIKTLLTMMHGRTKVDIVCQLLLTLKLDAKDLDLFNKFYENKKQLKGVDIINGFKRF